MQDYKETACSVNAWAKNDMGQDVGQMSQMCTATIMMAGPDKIVVDRYTKCHLLSDYFSRTDQ